MKQSAEQQYLGLLESIRDEGEVRHDRTGTGTRCLFGEQLRYDLREGFPALTSKAVALGAVAHELIWMLDGDNNLQYLAQNNVNIWNEWPFVSYLDQTGQARPEQGSDEWKAKMANFLQNIRENDNFAAKYGSLGPVYGYQWRHWPKANGRQVDQIAEAQDTIRNNPDSRRIIVSAWNTGDIEEMSQSGLPPCHAFFQFYVSNTRDPESGKPYLDMKLYQRSADMFLGVPFNMAQYAMLLTMMAQTTERTPRYFMHSFGDTHIYNNHIDQVNEQLSRRDDLYAPPTLKLNTQVTDITQFTAGDIEVKNYQHHQAIRAKVAI